MLPMPLSSSAQTARSSPPSAHMKNKSEFQVTIQSIPSQSAIIGWRHMAAELKSIGQQGWRRPNWCQLRLQRYCRNTGLPCRPLWQTTFKSLYHSARTPSAFILLFSPCLSIFCSGKEGKDFSSLGIKYNYAVFKKACGVSCGVSPFNLWSVCEGVVGCHRD